MKLNNLIWEWASKLPDWQRDLIKRLYDKDALDANDLDQVIDNLLFENGMNEKKQVLEVLQKDNIPNKYDENNVRITGLKNFKNIAAIESQHGIEFAPNGLTIVYGDNSAGKSSFAKVLKQACRAVDERTKVHPNIYNSSGESSTAEIHIINHNNEANVIKRVINKTPEQALSSISIFDTECSKIYVESESNVVFIPNELRIFDNLANHLSELKNRVQMNKDHLLNEKPVFQNIDETTQVKSFISSISYKTSKDDIDKNCNFTKRDEERLEKINQDLIALQSVDPSKAVQILERNIQDVTVVKQSLQTIEKELSLEKSQIYIDTHQRYLDNKQTLKVLTREAFEEQPLPGVGSNPWKKLWEAAKNYHQTAYPEKSFPNIEGGSKCLLCQQDINEEAMNRLKKFEDFVNETISQETKQLDILRQKNISILKSLPFETIRGATILSLLKDEIQNFEVNADLFIRSSSELKDYLLISEQNKSLWTDELPELSQPPIIEIDNWISEKMLEVQRLNQLMSQNNSLELIKEKKELTAKKIASEQESDIFQLMEIMKKINILDRVIKALDTTKITRKYNELASEYLSDHFRNEIQKELKELRCDHILFKINNRGVKGKSTIKLNLDSDIKVNINEILSEGEQKALSLAFFLAEINAMPNKGGIILDDPVSSLDHGRRDYVARRLVEEAKKRQVIIFTHDIVFLHILQKYSNMKNVIVQCCTIRRDGNRAGIVKPDFPWIAQKTKARIGYLKNELQKLKKQEKELDIELYSKEVKTWYMLLRESWERAVEELLLAGVIQRFEPSVKTQSLSSIHITDEKLNLINEGMTRASTFVHDESFSIGYFIPTNEEMKEDITKLETFSKLK
ncbi:AAA family ATPase [Gottfriedia acidiceleris]|uniref:AAA family ATPase n=1 Tax=Gottfriedia acidiceleris TaxID=371036 RepID=UPI002F265C25